VKFITDDVARDYVRKVAEMRAKQREFFDRRTKTPGTFAEARRLEHEVDKLTEALLDDRPTLFDIERAQGG